MPNKSKIKLFLASFLFIAIAQNLNFVSAIDLQRTSRVYSNLESNRTPVKSIVADSIIAKKSGGRSGGGSFKKRPSRSKSSSPASNSNRRQPSSPNYNYNQREYSSPSYRRKRQSTPSYGNRSYRSSRRGSAFGGLIFFIFVLIFLGGFLFVLFFILKQVSKVNSNSLSKTEGKIARERDNNRVTISFVQVALSNSASQIQQDLSELTKSIDTSSDAGLVELLQESALILLRNDRDWTHVSSHSHSLDISQAEEKFDRLSAIERSKFSSESLSNVDGKIKTRESRDDDSEGFPAYVVVTLIVGTADDNPLFDKIYNSEDLKQSLLRLSAMREDYLMKFELLWTPQQDGQYLTDEELLIEYTEIIPL